RPETDGKGAASFPRYVGHRTDGLPRDNVNTLNFQLLFLSPGYPMPINRLLQNSSFGPDEIKPLVDAFEGGISELRVDRNDPVAVALAQTIFTLAQQGERDVVLLRQRAVQAVSQSG